MSLFRQREEARRQREDCKKVPEPDGEADAYIPVKRLLSYETGRLQGIGTREKQEDSFGLLNAQDVTEIKKKGLLAVVADGMGGMEWGNAVSSAAVELLYREFYEMDREGDLARQLRDSVVRINGALYSEFGGRGGTTMAACIFFQERLYFASVGDSFLYLKRGEGLYRLNRDQNYRQLLYREAMGREPLDVSEAEEDPDGDRLSSFLGMETLREVDYLRMPLPLENQDVLLLCSDGVGGVLTEEELYACLEEAAPEEACARMDRQVRARRQRYQDNYTALVIACGY